MFVIPLLSNIILDLSILRLRISKISKLRRNHEFVNNEIILVSTLKLNQLCVVSYKIYQPVIIPFYFHFSINLLQVSTEGNWMHLHYQSKIQAKKALSKNGKVFGGSIMVGVGPCIDKVSIMSLFTALFVKIWLDGWLCLMSPRQQGHLEAVPPLTVPCEGHESCFLHRPHLESNPGSLRGSPLHNRCTMPAPQKFVSHKLYIIIMLYPNNMNIYHRNYNQLSLHSSVRCSSVFIS